MVCMFTLFTPFRLWTFVQIPSLDLSHLTFLNLCGFIKKYVQPHFVPQHSPQFLHEMHFLVIYYYFMCACIHYVVHLFIYLSKENILEDTKWIALSKQTADWQQVQFCLSLFFYHYFQSCLSVRLAFSITTFSSVFLSVSFSITTFSHVFLSVSLSLLLPSVVFLSVSFSFMKITAVCREVGLAKDFCETLLWGAQTQGCRRSSGWSCKECGVCEWDCNVDMSVSPMTGIRVVI